MKKTYGITKGKKNCSRCKKSLPVEEFGTSEPLKCGYNSRCKKCDSERVKITIENLSEDKALLRKQKARLCSKKNYYENRERYLQLAKERSKGNGNSSYYKKLYNMTLEEVQDMLSKQNNKCLICTVDLQSVGKYNTHVDHCHKTGKVRGILCRSCNLGIGHFKDNIETIKNAAKYLESCL